MSDPPDPPFLAERPTVRAAVEYAATMHTSQLREADRAPFILHPLEVAQLLRGREYPDEVVAAGVLHDVIEDAGVGLAELEEQFGPHVAALVSAVTEPSPDGDYRERKAALRNAVATAEPDAVAIYAADKVAKLRELRIRIATTHHAADQDTLEHYWASLQLLEERRLDDALVRQLRFELEALALLPPDGANMESVATEHG